MELDKQKSLRISERRIQTFGSFARIYEDDEQYGPEGTKLEDFFFKTYGPTSKNSDRDNGSS